METKKTAVIRHIGKRGRGKGQFMSPCGVAVTLTGISCVSFRNIFILPSSKYASRKVYNSIFIYMALTKCRMIVGLAKL